MLDRSCSHATTETPFDQFVEELRLKAFRLYESVRAVQRERDAGDRERLRQLAISGSLAVDLAEQIMFATPSSLPVEQEFLERDLSLAVGR